jgi:hypothetical protein
MKTPLLSHSAATVLLSTLLFSAVLFLLFCCSQIAEAATDSYKIHLIIAADTNDPNIGKLVEIDEKNIKKCFEHNVPSERLNIKKVRGNDFTYENLLTAIDNVQTNSDDTVVFYYTGHAAFNAADGLQYFDVRKDQNPKNGLYRKTVIEHIKKKNARLNVILTDCCNVAIPEWAVRNDNTRAFSLTDELPKTMTPIFVSLFGIEGTVDITSSKQGEYSVCDSNKNLQANKGSIFTYPLLDLFEQYRNVPKSWGDIVRELAPKVQEEFKSCYPNGVDYGRQRTQTIVAIYPNVQGPITPPDNTSLLQKVRYGARAKANPDGRGMLVTEVKAGMPAAQNNLQIGDIVLKINGKEVNTEQEYSDAVDASGQMMSVVIKEKSGQEKPYIIKLGW